MSQLFRGVLVSFDPATYTGSVQILQAGSTLLTNVPFATHIDGTSAVYGANCVVLFFDANNPNDAVVLACYPNGSYGVPSPPPGRITFISGFQLVSGATINSGVTATYTVTGSNGVPASALGVLCKLYYTSSTVGTYLQVAPHGASSIGNYVSLGNVEVASQFVNDSFIISAGGGQIDVKANGGNATSVNLMVYGYIF